MLHAAAWYLALLIVGGAGLLPAALLCERLHSGGVLYARPLAIAVIAVCAWLVGRSGVVPYGTPVVVAAVAALYAWSAAIAWRRPSLLDVVIARGRLLLVGEGLLLTVFALVALARAQAPDAVGTEKPMDLMLMTAVHAATRLPPPDPWLAGHTVSYYYLGHLAADAIGRLSGNPPAIAFNLATATAGALAAAAIAALAIDVLALGADGERAPSIRARWIAGGVAVAALLLITPIVGVAELVAANGIGPAEWWTRLGIMPSVAAQGARDGVPHAFWWWWQTTRVLPGTISEFPAFTLLLGDPHAHLLALPLDLVALALACVAFEGGTPLTWRRWLHDPQRLVLTALLFAAIFMTNAWDAVIFGAIWAGAGLLAARRAGWPWPLAAFVVGRWVALPAALALLIAAPFLVALDAPHLGIALVTGEHSDPARWLLVWLPPALPALAALLLLRPRGGRAAWRRGTVVAAGVVVAWIAWLLIAGHGVEVLHRGSGWIVLIALVGGAAGTGALIGGAERRNDRALAAALALIGAVLAVLGLTEVVRVADAFPGRLNTVFKFWFDAWAVLAVASGALAGLAAQRGRLPARTAARRVVQLGVGSAVVLALATAFFVPAMAVSRAREGQTRGLDALAYLRRDDPGLAGAIDWSRIHLDPRHDVVVQAVAESYTSGNMLAAASGVPTLLGWPNHERQWRASIPEAARRTAVDTIYTRGASVDDAALARDLGVTYVYVGREERARYGAGVDARFAAWPIAFAADGSLLVRVP